MAKTICNHCKTQAKTGTKKEKGIIYYGAWCESCGKKGRGKTEKEAIKAFMESKPTKNNDPFVIKQLPPPQSPEQLPSYFARNMQEITAITAPFLQAEKPALSRMVRLNMKYVMNNRDQNFMKCWETEEGRESIIDALEEAFSLGATLPAMGSIVPFNGIAEFIPSVEAFDFALTTGTTAPFKSLRIDPIHENDQYECYEEEGTENFCFRFKSIPANRGEVIAVVVRAEDRQGRRIGRIYDVDRLLEKAKQHSPSYRNYLLDKLAFETAKSEGKTKTEDGREYIEKTIEYREKGTGNKKSFVKKIFYDELKNPYEGPDQPEMLRKSAGKSFCAPFVKVRNSTAAMEELRGEEDQDEKKIDDMIDAAIDKAMDQFDDAETIEAEFSVEEEEEQPESEEEIDDLLDAALDEHQREEKSEIVKEKKKSDPPTENKTDPVTEKELF